MGDENGVDLRGIDAGCFHIGHHLAGGRLHLSAGAAVAQNSLAAGLDHRHGERDRNKIGRQSRLHHCRLDVFDRGIGDECGVVGFFPDAVVKGGHFGRADFVGHEAFGRIRRLLGEGGRDCEPRIEAERSRHGGGNHEVATRQVEHGSSPRDRSKAPHAHARRLTQDSQVLRFIPGARPCPQRGGLSEWPIVRNYQAINPLPGPWVPDLRSPGSSPGSLVRDTTFSCPGRVQRALLSERNETRDPARKSRSARLDPAAGHMRWPCHKEGEHTERAARRRVTSA